MAKITIIFRADGNSTIGMGHFSRTLALAEMLKDDFYCIYATQSPSTYQIDAIEKVCHDIIDLPANESHFDQFLNLLKGNELVVLDNYYFSTEFQCAIKAKGCKLVCIDDIHDKHFVADVIINHAEGVKKNQYSAEKYTTFCLGFKYALLRKEYFINASSINTKQFSCLIMMGGADPLNLNEKIISILNDLQLPIAVITGSGGINAYRFNQYKNIVLFKEIGPEKVLKLMQSAQIGIFPASTVAIEACAARLPFICGYYINNQKEIYKGIKENDLAICVGNYLNINPNDLINAYISLTKPDIADKIIKNQERLLDKKSKERFVSLFNKL